MPVATRRAVRNAVWGDATCSARILGDGKAHELRLFSPQGDIRASDPDMQGSSQPCPAYDRHFPADSQAQREQASSQSLLAQNIFYQATLADRQLCKGHGAGVTSGGLWIGSPN